MEFRRQYARRDIETGTAEITAAFSTIGEKLKVKATDDLDLERLVADAQEILTQRLPDKATRDAFDAHPSRVCDVKHRNQSRFELAEEDWECFHPRARKQLQDPTFWMSDLCGPHASEVGADVLREFTRWNFLHPRTSAVKFLQRLLDGWRTEVETLATKRAVIKKHEANPDHLELCDQIAIGLAFAAIKIRGRCPESVASLADAAIKRRKFLLKEGLISAPPDANLYNKLAAALS